MPLVQVKVIKGVFDSNQKQDMISQLTETMVNIEGEALRGVTWVTIEEVESGDWGIGGNAITAQYVKDLQKTPAVNRYPAAPRFVGFGNWTLPDKRGALPP
jgi:4-oxalocrotonate tautomerase